MICGNKFSIINGRGEKIYAPDAHVTRAEFISLIIRALKAELCAYSDSFEDVTREAWYADAVETALSLGLISDDIAFRPNDNITREEMAKIIVNAKELSDAIVVPDDFNIDFSDTHIINNWAKDFVSKACYIELLKGDENGNFNPKNNLTRAESAMVIYRFIAMGEKID